MAKETKNIIANICDEHVELNSMVKDNKFFLFIKEELIEKKILVGTNKSTSIFI
jgi:hypothetical protein